MRIIAMSLSSVAAVVLLGASLTAGRAHADNSLIIERVKPSVVAIGTFERTRTPQFQFLGTGFAVGDGTLVATNFHVLPKVLDPAHQEVLAIVIPAPTKDGTEPGREAKQIAVDPTSDLALLKLQGPALPTLKIGDSDAAKEGQEVLFTGFPIGGVLGLYPATHRGIISAITPIAIAQARASELDAQTIRRLASGAFPVFQLDATAYPGNSGSPVYDPATGEVLAIVNMVFVKGTKEAVLTQPSGIAYAVPASRLQTLLKSAR
jgi:S1-C subfamily serine protease